MAKSTAAKQPAYAPPSNREQARAAIATATSDGSQKTKAKVPLVKGQLADGNAAGVVLTAFDVSQANPPSNIYIYRRAYLSYEQPATAAEKAALKLGVKPLVFGSLAHGIFSTNDGNANANPFLGTCNTVVFRMMGKMKTPTRCGSSPVTIQRPAAPITDPLAVDPFNPGVQLASAGPELTDGVAIIGSNGQDLARLFLRSFNVVGTQCDELLFNVPLCDITCYDCGDTFQGASDQMYPILPILKDLNARLDEIEADLQAFPQNTDGEGPISPILIPVTVGAPTNNCAGVYDFARPLISLADSPVNVSLEVNPACVEDLTELFKLIDRDTLLPITASDRNSGLVAPGPAALDVDASGAATMLYFGGFCFTLEFHALRMTNEDLAACWSKYMADHPDAICEKLWNPICNTCKGIPVLEESEMELDAEGAFTGLAKDGTRALRKHVPQDKSLALNGPR